VHFRCGILVLVVGCSQSSGGVDSGVVDAGSPTDARGDAQPECGGSALPTGNPCSAGDYCVLNRPSASGSCMCSPSLVWTCDFVGGN
jgi:hypothetical protein